MTDPTIDPTTLQELQDSAGADFVVELVSTFLEEAPQILAELRSALTVADAERFRRAAHSLKSNSQTFGATGLAAQARALELGGIAALGGDGAAALDRLTLSYEQAAAALKALCHG